MAIVFVARLAAVRELSTRSLYESVKGLDCHANPEAAETEPQLSLIPHFHANININLYLACYLQPK
jgi:hypothetical protein